MTPIRQVAILLLLLQAVSSFFLWTLNVVGTVSEGRFAVFLGIDLLCFATIVYIYTHQKWEELISRTWILAGSFGLIILLLSSLYFH